MASLNQLALRQAVRSRRAHLGFVRDEGEYRVGIADFKRMEALTHGLTRGGPLGIVAQLKSEALHLLLTGKVYFDEGGAM